MSSKRRLRRKACDGKIAHPTKLGAQIHMRKVGGVKGGYGVYQCKHCRKWHVGHTRGSRFLITSALTTGVLYHD
jgi:hypothetical protein